MKVTITINCDNAAFGDYDTNGCEVARILQQAASGVDGTDLVPMASDFTLFDSNGNRVGEMKVTER